MAKGRSGVIAAGSWLVDRNKTIDAWPAEETVAEILDERHEGGGAGFNMAVDLRRLGATFPIAAMGLIGDDAEGRFLVAAAAAHGIDTAKLCVTSDAPTAATDVMSSRATGKRTFFHTQGTHALMGPDLFEFDDSRAKYLHLGMPCIHRRLDAANGTDPNGWVTILKRAGAAGLKRNMEIPSVSRARIAEVVGPCLPHLDFLIVNEYEIGALAGIETERDGVADPAACRRAAERTIALGVRDLAVVHFPGGAIAVTRDGDAVAQPSVRVPPCVIQGTNGAGDAFAAGLLLTLHDGGALSDGLVLGHAAAAASLRAVSTIGAVEAAHACRALAQGWGWRDDFSV